MSIMQTMKSTVQTQKNMLHAIGGIDSMYDAMDDMLKLKNNKKNLMMNYKEILK